MTLDGRRRMLLAHRVSYELAHGLAVGSVPADLVICHRCDNPPCVRPDHLFLGTMSDNARDAVVKGRYDLTSFRQRGEANHAAKLTEPDVIELRRRYAAGEMSQAALAEVFGVSRAAVRHALSGANWRHVE